MESKKRTLSRKEFLKTSVAGMAGLWLSGMVNGDYYSAHANINSEKQALIELGRTGLKVTPIGFGASRTMEPSLVMAVLEAGLNFLDTGRSYFRGQNEIMVGKAIAGFRKDVIVQSKLRVAIDNKGLESAEEIRRVLAEMEASLQASLRALQTDYLDILLIHGAVSSEVIHHETITGFFEKEKKKGTIRARGFSAHTNQVELMRAANLKLFYDVIMVPYNHRGSYVHMNTGHSGQWDQVALEKEIDRAKENGVGIIAMKTCSGGPYAAGPEIKPSYEQALRWIIGRRKVHTMAVAMANFSQIQEDLKALR